MSRRRDVWVHHVHEHDSGSSFNWDGCFGKLFTIGLIIGTISLIADGNWEGLFNLILIVLALLFIGWLGK